MDWGFGEKFVFFVYMLFSFILGSVYYVGWTLFFGGVV